MFLLSKICQTISKVGVYWIKYSVCDCVYPKVTGKTAAIFVWVACEENLYYDACIGNGEWSLYWLISKWKVYSPTRAMKIEKDLEHVIKEIGTILMSIVQD